ncbi:MAG: twin-arginine translocase TatA/TatE family subunit [Deltaproteobacteria bacterium]|nr:twin-arginine translocase TatA/TatE family subunit [Deltaproteobacteria bacterium]MCL4873012.1 twin-arginine translocase TatA/TatE family subunit [bacterium]
MFGIGIGELILVLIAALIALGPEKLPQMAKALGKAYTEFMKAGEEVKKSFREAAAQTGVKGPEKAQAAEPGNGPVPGKDKEEA